MEDPGYFNTGMHQTQNKPPVFIITVIIYICINSMYWVPYYCYWLDSLSEKIFFFFFSLTELDVHLNAYNLQSFAVGHTTVEAGDVLIFL